MEMKKEKIQDIVSSDKFKEKGYIRHPDYMDIWVVSDGIMREFWELKERLKDVEKPRHLRDAVVRFCCCASRMSIRDAYQNLPFHIRLKCQKCGKEITPYEVEIKE